MGQGGTTQQRSEQELRKMELPQIASEARQAWDPVKQRLAKGESISSDELQRIAPYFDVLTDQSFVKQHVTA